jgi:hypothetical protein
MASILGILESSATQWYQDVASTRHFFFSIVLSIVYGWYPLTEMLDHTSSINQNGFVLFLSTSRRDKRTIGQNRRRRKNERL